MIYVVSGVKLVLDKTVNDRALANCLVADEDYLEFYCVLLVGCETELFVKLGTHAKSKYY